MGHSNNAARIRLWIQIKGLESHIDTKMVTFADLQSEEYKKCNPLKKVPGFLCETGQTIFES
jgi:glutathione S-transferase